MNKEEEEQTEEKEEGERNVSNNQINVANQNFCFSKSSDTV